MTEDTKAMTDWEHFIDGTPWLLHDVSSVEVDEPRPANADGIDGERFPQLRRLVASASETPVTLGTDKHELLTWSHPVNGERFSWLCMAPGESAPEAFPDHQELLNAFGGVVERSTNEPSTWLSNCDDALTAREATNDASFLADYAWMVEELGTTWPIDPQDYYSICREANGNDTICHRVTGDVLLFAPDHDFDHLDVLEGCPPYSLYRIRGGSSFTQWVDEVARQWSAVRGLG
jgi:hypothetical protein